jgi:hypothetical protein
MAEAAIGGSSSSVQLDQLYLPDVAGRSDVCRVDERFLTPAKPGTVLADCTSHTGSTTFKQGSVSGSDRTLFPASQLLAQDEPMQPQPAGGATAAKPAAARDVALVPIELSFKGGILRRGGLQRDHFEGSLNGQLDSQKVASIVEKNWSGASVEQVKQTYKMLGEMIREQVTYKGVNVLLTDLLPPKDQRWLEAALRGKPAREQDMIALMHRIDPSTVAIRDDVLVQSNDYRKLEAYIACLGEAAAGGIEVRALEPGETPKPDLGQYVIILRSGMRADVSDATRIRARIVNEAADPNLTPAARAGNLVDILDPGVTPDILARALSNLSQPEIQALQGAMEALAPQAVRAVATALAPAICQMDDYDLANAFLVGIGTASRKVNRSSPDSLAIDGARVLVAKHAAKEHAAENAR